MINDITLVVADDHPLLLNGLVQNLLDFNYTVLGTAVNGAQALEEITKNHPSIAILDEEMPLLNGLEVIKKCKEDKLNTKFIILTSHKEKAFVYKAQKLNISGYLLKDEPFIEIHKALQSVYKGIHYFSTVFSHIIDKEIAPQLQKLKLLSPSERIIVRLISQGNSSKDISEMLSLSIRTVDKHRSNIITKLGIKDDKNETSSLTQWAKENSAFIAST